MTDKNVEMMKKLIMDKKAKSNEQSGHTRNDKSFGTKKPGVKKLKKCGLFDK